MNTKELRAKLGWTQTDLAFFLNIHWQSVSAWENGHKVPSKKNQSRLDDLVVIAEYYERQGRDYPPKVIAGGITYQMGETVEGLTRRNYKLTWVQGRLEQVFARGYAITCADGTRPFCAQIRKVRRPQ